MSTETVDKFNLQLVHDSFLTSLYEEDDVCLKSYLESYSELNKFFNLMGTVFGFVSKDLKAKMDIMYTFLNNEDKCDNFTTVKKMILYEKESKLLTKKGYVSGSRTLLRLHRGLDFIREFLKKVGELENEDNTSNACREAYEQTLAKYHSFVVKNGAKIAMYTMPTREQLLKRVCGDNEENIQCALNILPKTLEVTADVYKRIENLYTVHNLHSLP